MSSTLQYGDLLRVRSAGQILIVHLTDLQPFEMCVQQQLGVEMTALLQLACEVKKYRMALSKQSPTEPLMAPPPPRNVQG